ncbi:hypothetical protein GCM10009720_09580 [Yaniella flava]|uniref:Uncharacterized protein n=1 Tax=Yaniella flava TaxID=287930 RepID=A0ABN2U975_9MICC
MVGAGSIETVKIIHGTYFEGRSRRLIENALDLFHLDAIGPWSQDDGVEVQTPKSSGPDENFIGARAEIWGVERYFGLVASVSDDVIVSRV